jgi:hypothetical protein
MRERIDAQNKELKRLREEGSTLRAETRRLQARDAFREAGFQPVHGDLFAAQNPEGDIAPDAIVGFAQTYGLTPVAPKEPAPEGEAEKGVPAERALAGMSRSGSRPGEGGQPPASNDRSMTRDAWLELAKSDPAAARKAVQEGRVQIRKDNPFASRR